MKTIFVISIYFILQLSVSTAQSQNHQETISAGITLQKKLLKGEKHEYNVQLKKNEHFEMTVLQKGVDLIIEVFDSGDKLIETFDSPNGNSGPEQVNVVSQANGDYRLIIYPLIDDPTLSDSVKENYANINQGEYEINSVKILTDSEYKNKSESIKLKHEKLTSSLKEFAHPLKSVEPGTGFKDLEFLKPVLKDVKYAGLGEATHGTKEFFQMKARMLEFLVKKMGFTVFAIEASYAGCNNINEYVLNGKGDAYTALASQGFWTWNTEEVINMIEWMRSYNKGVSDDKKVKFLGFDIQVNSQGGAFDILKNYLKKVDSVRVNQMNDLFQTFKRMDKMDTENLNLDSCKKEYFAFLGFLVMNKGNYIQKSSPEEYEKVLQYARVIGQLYDAYFMNEGDVRKNEREWRDYYMASNFNYLVQQEKPGTKFVIWAHNGHISKNDEAGVNGGSKPFGSYLKNTFGDEYYAFGFSFSKGSYQSIEVTNDSKYIGLQEFTVQPAKENSLDWYFSLTGYPKFIINFRDKNLPDNLVEFTKTTFQTRSYGAVSNRNYVEFSYAPVIIDKEFDGMIFIDNTSRSIPTPTGR